MASDGITWGETASQIDYTPDEVWCATGSGILAAALSKAWPHARICGVQVGREAGVAFSEDIPFAREYPRQTPFPSNRYYDAKARHICQANKGTSKILFGTSRLDKGYKISKSATILGISNIT